MYKALNEQQEEGLDCSAEKSSGYNQLVKRVITCVESIDDISEKVIDSIYVRIHHIFVRRKWITASSINSHLPVHQIYVWLLDDKNRVVIVSKDGKKWQIPGGKPEKGEDMWETGMREVLEETTLNIYKHKYSLKLYGYYEVKEGKFSKVGKYGIQHYIQARMILRMNTISVPETVNSGVEGEPIKYVKLVNLGELGKYMPWVLSREEFHLVEKNHSKQNYNSDIG